QGQLLLSLAYHQLNEDEKARAALGAATQIIDHQLPRADSDDLGDGWLNWVFCQAVRREAEAVIAEKWVEPRDQRRPSGGRRGRRRPAGVADKTTQARSASAGKKSPRARASGLCGPWCRRFVCRLETPSSLPPPVRAGPRLQLRRLGLAAGLPE